MGEKVNIKNIKPIPRIETFSSNEMLSFYNIMGVQISITRSKRDF